MLKQKIENSSHNNYKFNKAYYKDFIDFIEKIKKAYFLFSESINDIINKKSNFFDNNTSIFYSLMLNLKNLMATQSVEYKDLASNLMKEIIDPCKIILANNDKNEEILCKEYNDINKRLKKAKLKLEENKNIYLTKMKETEKLIFEEKSMKINSITSNQEIKDKNKIAFSSVCDSMQNEDNYTNSLNEVNEIIEELNDIENKLSKFYEETESKTLNKIKENLYYFMTIIKSSNSKINYDINDFNKKCLDIKLENNIKSLLEKNKYTLSKQKKLMFEPYVPFSSLYDSIKSSSQNEKMNVNYEVILYLKKFFTGICEDLDMKEEKKRKQFRELCLRIFDENTQNYVKEDQDELIKFMENQVYRQYFISSLTLQRTNGRYKREKKLFNELIEILKIILEYAEKENNFDNARNCIILSQTFYIEENKDGKIEKIYLMEYIKNNKWLSSPKFWKEYIEDEITKDKLKFEEENKNGGGDVKQIYFSKLITYSHNMNMFCIKREDALNIINYFIEKYEISESMKNTVLIDFEYVYDEKKTVGNKEIQKNENTQKNVNNEITENNNNHENENEIGDTRENTYIKKDETKNEIKNIISENQNEIKNETINENNKEIKNEINKNNNIINEENKNEIKNQNINENKKEIVNEENNNEIKKEIINENNNEIKNEIKDDNQKDIRNEIINENSHEIKKEINNDNNEDNKNVIINENINITKNDNIKENNNITTKENKIEKNDENNEEIKIEINKEINKEFKNENKIITNNEINNNINNNKDINLNIKNKNNEKKENKEYEKKDKKEEKSKSLIEDDWVIADKDEYLF